MFRRIRRFFFNRESALILIGRIEPPIQKRATPPAADGWRRSDLSEGRAVRFASCSHGSGKIAADDLEFKALSTGALISKKGEFVKWRLGL